VEHYGKYTIGSITTFSRRSGSGSLSTRNDSSNRQANSRSIVGIRTSKYFLEIVYE